MKSKLATVIMTIIIFLIIGVFTLFGMILWEELKRLETSVQPEGVKTILSENTNTVDKEIKTPQILENPFGNIQDANKQIEEVDYSNIAINKYFYRRRSKNNLQSF